VVAFADLVCPQLLVGVEAEHLLLGRTLNVIVNVFRRYLFGMLVCHFISLKLIYSLL
jgi:hypothetical protein